MNWFALAIFILQIGAACYSYWKLRDLYNATLYIIYAVSNVVYFLGIPFFNKH